MLYGVGDCMIALLYRDCLKARKPGFVALEILGICVTLAVESAMYDTLQPVMDMFLSFVLPGLLVTISVFKLSSLVYGDHICDIISSIHRAGYGIYGYLVERYVFSFLVVVPIYAAGFIFGVLKHCFHDYSMVMADVVSFVVVSFLALSVIMVCAINCSVEADSQTLLQLLILLVSSGAMALLMLLQHAFIPFYVFCIAAVLVTLCVNMIIARREKTMYCKTLLMLSK